MKKYMVIYHAPAAAIEQVRAGSPEDQKEDMAPWMAWVERCGDGLVDLGNTTGGRAKGHQVGKLAKRQERGRVLSPAGR